MITTILRAPTGAGIHYCALQLAERARIANEYVAPVAVIVPPIKELIEQWKRIAGGLDILVNVYRPNEWKRLRAGQGNGIVLVNELRWHHLNPILQALQDDTHEHWLLNPPLEIEIEIGVNLQPRPPRRIDGKGV
ncbi:hypothetical protein [Bordetella phage vB_BbrM_PHB04]|uniref:Uncharacterized protein n=1 Tax=Bordetella phage vB_BbrM_PHB04 TaxID=2029657 RepID=A0A291L9Y9_9CAUD|nr:hypothetical protein HOS14_gp074 [Bordetella phage vB_BbrM_PHB04]ATI15692.1 hypothetical protein [Bordetella phage vB_BbrM_PHB04]